MPNVSNRSCRTAVRSEPTTAGRAGAAGRSGARDAGGSGPQERPVEWARVFIRRLRCRDAAFGLVLAGLAALGSTVVPATAQAAADCVVSETSSAATPADAGTPAWRRARVVAAGDDLQVCADGRLLLSLHEQSVRALRAEFPGEWPFLSVAYEVRVLSLLGPYLSVEERRVSENPATYLRERVRVYDLRTPGRVVTLDELFEDAALKPALLQHEPLRQAVGTRALARAASGTDSRGMAQRLSEATRVDREGKVFLPPGWLGGFWFDSRRGRRLDLGLALPVRSGMREETLARGRLVLPASRARGGVPLDGMPQVTDGGSPAAMARWSFTGRP